MQCTYHILGNCELARTKHGKLRLVSMFIPLILPILLTIDVYTHLGLTIFIHIYIDNNIYIYSYMNYIYIYHPDASLSIKSLASQRFSVVHSVAGQHFSGLDTNLHGPPGIHSTTCPTQPHDQE